MSTQDRDPKNVPFAEGDQIIITGPVYRIDRDGEVFVGGGTNEGVRFYWDNDLPASVKVRKDGPATMRVAPVWQVGEVVTEEMGEPPVGAVVHQKSGTLAQWAEGRTEGRWWTRYEHGWTDRFLVGFYNWDVLVGRAGEDGLVLVSLPDAWYDEPKHADWCCSVHCGPDSEHGNPHGAWKCYQKCNCEAQEGAKPEEPEPSPTPEVREVPIAALTVGEHVTVTLDGVVTGTQTDDGSVRIRSHPAGAFEGWFFSGAGVVFTAKPKPLPTAPGTVGTATVRGIKGVRVHYINSGCAGATAHWWSPGKAIEGFDWHEPQHLTDFVELLAGEQ